MKKIDIAIQKFQLADFVKTTIEGNKHICSKAVFTFKNPNKIEHEDDDYEQRPADEVMTKFLAGDYLYANFSNCGVDQPVISCIDGGEYLLLDDADAEDYFEDEEDIPEGFICTNGIYLDECSSLGYLLKLENDVVTIQAVSYSMACGESVEVLGDVGVFSQPMEEYVKRFIK